MIKGYTDLPKIQKEFSTWLAEEEKITNSKYIPLNGLRKRKMGKQNELAYHYICHRSGYYDCKATGKRQIKSQGTCKIDATCISSIEVIERDNVQAKYYSTHFGHDFFLEQLPLSKSDKDIIPGKLVQDISSKRILKDIHNSMRENVERIHLISQKDLNNICRSYGISQNNNQMHENDSISIAAWVENQINLANNCALFYKEQSQYHPEVHNDDFILIIMNKLQHTMMMKFGTDHICTDSTHGITGYDFELTTAMVIDEYEEGFPVAFCLSSIVNTQILKLYFQSIKKVIGEISCNIFTSDDACMFINAWTEIMGPPKKDFFVHGM